MGLFKLSPLPHADFVRLSEQKCKYGGDDRMTATVARHQLYLLLNSPLPLRFWR